MIEYRIKVAIKKERQWHIVFAKSAQEAADKIRNEIANCTILVIAQVLGNWQ